MSGARDNDAPAWRIRVRGVVQGVGFRPFVWRLAREMGLAGDVRNDAEGVVIRLLGDHARASRLAERIGAEAPPLSFIAGISIEPLKRPFRARDFTIAPSRAGEISTHVPPDAATCPECLEEIRTPGERRYRHPFANCTNCGPRLSIVRAIPYDRENTSMSAFAMCDACRAEYEDPADRRFHAQPIACPDCGPRVWLADARGRPLDCGGHGAAPDAPLREAAALLARGCILAIRGLGGYHLACDATDDEAVAALRARKRRPHKPLALMARDIGMVERYAHVPPRARELLQSPAAPIVLLPARKDGGDLSRHVAPGMNALGFMLPSTPLHHLLMEEMPFPLVMTSANISGEPQITDNDEALEKLAGIADFWLMHDREIVNRVDDSVAQVLADGTTAMLRRARGHAPEPLKLHPGFAAAPGVLALGGDLKNAFCLLRGGEAVLSQHIGDLAGPLTQKALRRALALYERMLGFAPEAIVTDTHPGYFSVRLGEELARRRGLPLLGVQHHHAHVAAVMAEHGMGPESAPVLGVVLDGLGMGADGTLWGGEFLLATYAGHERLAHFPPVAMPGADAASRQPWRNAVAHLLAAFGREEALRRMPAHLRRMPVEPLARMIERGLNAPPASSAGRLFDAVAAILGIAPETMTYEGQAAMLLQALAERAPDEEGSYGTAPLMEGTWRPLWEGILADLRRHTGAERIAARFHNTLARLVARESLRLAEERGISTIVLTGGVFQNALLLARTRAQLSGAAPEILIPRRYPANDAALSLGQATIATRLMRGEEGGRSPGIKGTCPE